MIKRIAFSLAIGLLVVAAAWGVSLSGISFAPLRVFAVNALYPAVIATGIVWPMTAGGPHFFCMSWALWSALIFAFWSLVALIARLRDTSRSTYRTQVKGG